MGIFNDRQQPAIESALYVVSHTAFNRAQPRLARTVGVPAPGSVRGRNVSPGLTVLEASGSVPSITRTSPE